MSAYQNAGNTACLPVEEVAFDQAILLAGIQALCISADQEWCRQEGKLSDFDKGWFTGQLNIFDLYTGVEKSAIAEARAYIEKLSAATVAPAGATPVAEVGSDRTGYSDVITEYLPSGTKLYAVPASPRDATEALDAEFPIPDSPHGSVRQHAEDNRKAFLKGWNAGQAAMGVQP